MGYGGATISAPQYGPSQVFDKDGKMLERVIRKPARTTLFKDLDSLYRESDAATPRLTFIMTFPRRWTNEDIQVALHIAKESFSQGEEAGIGALQCNLRDLLGVGE